MNSEETDWYSVTTTPTRIGVYKTRHRGSDMKIYEGYSWWNGEKWRYTQKSVGCAAFPSGLVATQQSREWKGLKEKT